VRAAIYARVSSATQRERHTIENQLRSLPEYIRAQGWSLTETYVDDGRSAKAGKLDEREGFARCLRDAEARRFDVLVVADVDRLTRTDDMQERARILGPFQRAGIQIVTPSGGALDLRTMFGELWVTMQALVGAEENRKRAERIKSGKLRAIAEGRKPAGPTPFGLAYDRTTGKWSIDAARAAIVREIIERVGAGESCIVIADDLHERGAPSPRGHWTRHKVWQVARSRHVVGVWVADKARRLSMPVPAIVSESAFQAAQAALMEHGKRGLRRTKHVYLLEGLAICGKCGAPIAIRSATRNPRRTNGNPSPAAYVCRARKLVHRGERRCDATIVLVADMDERVWHALASKIRDPGLTAEIEKLDRARSANRRNWKSDADSYRARLARLQHAESAIVARFRRGLISEPTFDNELAALGREKTMLTEQIVIAERAAAGFAEDQRPAPDVVAQLHELASASATPAERRRVVEAIVAPGAVLDGDSVTLTLLVEAGSRAERGVDVEPSFAVVPG
jgi:site-specific DNA recombinase